MTSRNAVARALHHLFGALQHAEAGGAGAAPVPVNPGELREALAALPNQLFQLGEWAAGFPIHEMANAAGWQSRRQSRLRLLQAGCCRAGLGAGAGAPGRRRLASPPALSHPPSSSHLPAAGEMSDAGETLLSMFEQIREASPGAAAGLDAMFGLKVRPGGAREGSSRTGGGDPGIRRHVALLTCCVGEGQ